jgi:hypothetical protein
MSNIGTTSNIQQILFTEQASDPTQPASGKWLLYTKSGGLYLEDDGGTVLQIGGTVTEADFVMVDVRKASAGTISEGNPVYPVSWNVAGYLEVEAADAASSATMPALGVMEEDVTTSASKNCVISGHMTGIDTNAYTLGDELFVANGGGFTTTKPTGTNLIQKMAQITRKNASVGSMAVTGAGRVNDLPNIPEGQFWLGDSTGVPVATDWRQQEVYYIAGALTVASQTLRIPNFSGVSRTIVTVGLMANTAPVGANIIVDIHKDGTTIFTTQSNRPNIVDGSNSGSSSTIEVPTWANLSYLTVDVDQIGSGTAGSDLSVVVVYR